MTFADAHQSTLAQHPIWNSAIAYPSGGRGGQGGSKQTNGRTAAHIARRKNHRRVKRRIMATSATTSETAMTHRILTALLTLPLAAAYNFSHGDCQNGPEYRRNGKNFSKTGEDDGARCRDFPGGAWAMPTCISNIVP